MIYRRWVDGPVGGSVGGTIGGSFGGLSDISPEKIDSYSDVCISSSRKNSYKI